MSWASSFISWASEAHIEIEAVGAVVGILGTIGGLVAIAFAYKQLSDTRKALQSSNAYTIQKEAREIIGKLQSDQNFYDYMFEHDSAKAYDPEVVKGVNRQLGLVFHFYLSVYRMAKAKSITKELISSMGKDFTGFIGNPQVKKFYDAKKGAGAYDSEFDEMVAYWAKNSR